MPGRPMLPPICLIIFCASAKRLSSWLTSVTVTPEPLAMRTRREALMIFGLARSPGVIDRMIAAIRSKSLVVDLPSCSFICAHAGHHAEQVGDRAHPADRDHLLEEVLEGEPLAAEQLAGHPLGLVGVEGLLGLLDEGEHVAHAEDARGHPLGVEDVEVLQLLAGGGEHDRLAGDVPHRQRGTTAGVAVELGEHDAGEADAVAERLGGGDRVLADHRVDDEQHLVGLDRVADVGGLRIISASMPSRPAVSTMTMSCMRAAGVLDRVAGDLRPGRRRRCPARARRRRRRPGRRPPAAG